MLCKGLPPTLPARTHTKTPESCSFAPGCPPGPLEKAAAAFEIKQHRPDGDILFFPARARRQRK